MLTDEIGKTHFGPPHYGHVHLDPHLNGSERRTPSIRLRFDQNKFNIEREGNTIRIRSKDDPTSHIAPYVYELKEDGSGIESFSKPLPPDVSKLASETPVRDLFRKR